MDISVQLAELVAKSLQLGARSALGVLLRCAGYVSVFLVTHFHVEKMDGYSYYLYPSDYVSDILPKVLPLALAFSLLIETQYRVALERKLIGRPFFVLSCAVLGAAVLLFYPDWRGRFRFDTANLPHVWMGAVAGVGAAIAFEIVVGFVKLLADGHERDQEYLERQQSELPDRADPPAG